MDSSRVYCTLDELKAELQVDSSREVYDLQFEAAIEGVCRSIDMHCGRRFWMAAETRYYTATGATCLYVPDLLSITALRSDDNGDASWGTTWSATCYYLAPVNATMGPEPAPYWQVNVVQNSSISFPTGIPRGVQITGNWGYSTGVPALIKKATLIQSGFDWRAIHTPINSGPDLTGGNRRPPGGLHPFVERMLAPYRLPRAV